MKRLMTIALTSAIMFAAVAPKPAHAYIIVGGRIIHSDPLITTAKIVLCLWLLPICLIDGDGSNSSVSSESLAEQGYSPLEIAQIEADQKYVTTAFAEKNFGLGINELDTRASIRNDILSVAPLASDLYLDFMADMKGLK